CVALPALVASPMAAGMIGKVEGAAVATEKLAAPIGGATTQDGRPGSAMSGRDGLTELGSVRRPVTAEDLRQMDHVLAGLDLAVQLLQGCAGARLTDGGQVGIDNGSVERGMTEVLGNLAQRDP